MKNSKTRTEIEKYIGERYGAQAEYLWERDPNSCVFRHEDNRKWFGIIMVISGRKIGLESSEPVEILNLKLTDTLAVDLLTQNDGYYSAYHMGAGSTWITVILDGTVPVEAIIPLVDESYGVTSSKAKKEKKRPPKEWLIPANPKYYDVQGAFENSDFIMWKQGAGIKKGDSVFMYVAAPVSAILYKCAVIETDIPYERENEHIRITKLMKIKLEARYAPDRFTFDTLKSEFGIFAVRGPRSVTKALSIALMGLD